MLVFARFLRGFVFPLSVLAGANSTRAEITGDTIAMVRMLTELDRTQRNSPHGYLNHELIPHFENAVQSEMPLPEWFQRHHDLAQNFIRANHNTEAVAVIELILSTTNSLPPDVRSQIEPPLFRMMGLAWLREAEQKNCLLNHSAESCLFPIAGSGVHQLTEYSEAAMQAFAQALETNPEDKRARWLWNIAAMTLGRYPTAVPLAHRLPESTWESDADIGHFPDISMAAGISQDGLSGGGIAEDFNGDGWLDLMVSSWSLQDQVRLFINQGNGTFTDASQASGIQGITGGLNMIHADYDNDGDADVLVLRGAWLGKDGKQPNSLLRNDGKGAFTDVTSDAGILSFHPTQTAAWWDFDGDGWLDLFIGNESTSGESHPCELFHNNGDGTFAEVASLVGINVEAWVKGVAAGDFNNDGLTDLYLSVLDGPNYLWANRGGEAPESWRFENVATISGVAEPMRSFPCWFWDFDNDGWEDIFVSGFGAEHVGDAFSVSLGEPNGMIGPRLYRNNQRGGFDDISASAGLEQCWLPMGANFGDINNDGKLDFYVATGDTPMDLIVPNKMFLNQGNGRFADITTSGGFGHLQKGHAVSFADFDHDGDQDVHTVMGGAFSGDRYMNALFQNPGHGNDWLKLEFSSAATARTVMGTRVQIDLQNDDGSRTLHRTLGTGGSFGGNPLRMEIGLGKNAEITQLIVKFPGHEPRQFTGDQVAPNKLWRISPRTIESVALPLPANPNHRAHHHGVRQEN